MPLRATIAALALASRGTSAASGARVTSTTHPALGRLGAALRCALPLATAAACAAAVCACAVLNSHAAAARQLFGGTDRNYWCWSREAGSGIPKPCVPKEAYAAIWQCVHDSPHVADTLRSVERSREELIDCMHAHGWVDYAVAIGR